MTPGCWCFCNLIIIAIYGAIKSSIFFPYGLYVLSYTCLDANIHHRWWREGSKDWLSKAGDKVHGGRRMRREVNRHTEREGKRETEKMRQAFCVCAD